MRRDWLDRIRRGLRKPPGYVAQRIIHELQVQLERRRAPHRARRMSPAMLAHEAGYGSVGPWWDALSARPYLTPTQMGRGDLERLCPGDEARILGAAERALARNVALLGSGPVDLGADIDWHRDYKSGHRWPPAYGHDIEYNNPERPSDVKFPWELSRMQWMVPLGQAYALTGEERYAMAARDLLGDWIAANPYAHSVNWSCTMEVALRIVSWSWFFHVFNRSRPWAAPDFRERFLQTLYLHGDYTARNLEKSDINGNHYTADAAGLVFAGLFFGGRDGERWLELGWSILCDEMPRQVYADGVDFEASVAYHRLVQELFLLPALYRMRCGLAVPEGYRQRLVQMARFTAAYSRSDGSAPLWGDADDGRVLPFGAQDINDHRYLVGIAAAALDARDLENDFSGSRSELLWLLGAQAAAGLPNPRRADVEQTSVAFPDGGFYVLRNRQDHVFVDCGPVGLGGRGGHGHNDVLSFEAVLDGAQLVSDCGSYLYTADYGERNRFRSTAYHNTPQVDGEEINRYIRWDYLWTLHNDAPHEVREVKLGPQADRLVISHGGYRRLTPPVIPVRTLTLAHAEHRLTIHDSFEGEGEHRLTIPLHLAREVEVTDSRAGRLLLRARERRFALTWCSEAAWQLRIEPGRISPSYGVVCPATLLVWQHEGPLASLTVVLEPLADESRAAAASSAAR